MNSFLIAAADAPAASGTGQESAHSGITLGVHWLAPLGNSTYHVDSLMISIIVMVLLLVVFGLLGRTVNRLPNQQSGMVGTVVEEIVGFCQKIIQDFIGHGTEKFLWFIGSMFLFILFANWLNLLPWKAWEIFAGENLGHVLGLGAPLSYEAPTADLNITGAMALWSLFFYWFFGIKQGGIGRFIGHHWFAKPAFLFPLRMLEDLTRPFSLALRLFANITAGHAVGLILLSLTFFVIPATLLPLELVISSIQAFIFAALSASYIGAAMATEEHH